MSHEPTHPGFLRVLIVGTVVAYAIISAFVGKTWPVNFDGFYTVADDNSFAVLCSAILGGIVIAAAFNKLRDLWYRFSCGMNPRLPAAIFLSWLLIFITYTVLHWSGDWWEYPTDTFWPWLVTPPTIATIVVIVFRWALASKIERTQKFRDHSSR